MKMRIVLAVLDDEENHLGNATYIDILSSSKEEARRHLNNFEAIILEQLEGDIKTPYESFIT